jgi:stage II sporulation protein AA (anti-sigma F factor antagonist)
MIKNVVVDLCRTDYCGSTALGLIVRLWRRVRQNGGRMALCNLSEHEREIFAIAKLDSLWPICLSREDALQAIELMPDNSKRRDKPCCAGC